MCIKISACGGRVNAYYNIIYTLCTTSFDAILRVRRLETLENARTIDGFGVVGGEGGLQRVPYALCSRFFFKYFFIVCCYYYHARGARAPIVRRPRFLTNVSACILTVKKKKLDRQYNTNIICILYIYRARARDAIHITYYKNGEKIFSFACANNGRRSCIGCRLCTVTALVVLHPRVILCTCSYHAPC